MSAGPSGTSAFSPGVHHLVQGSQDILEGGSSRPTAGTGAMSGMGYSEGAGAAGGAGGQEHTPGFDESELLEGEEGGILPTNIMFVRAAHDYQATDPAALSFSTGDIIAVQNRLESGWWDGTLGQERGWFPSNYVEPLYGDEEVSPTTATRLLEAQSGFVLAQAASDAQRSAPVHPTGDGELEGKADDELGWDDAMNHNRGWGLEGDGLDDLTREIMRGAGAEDDEGGFLAAAADRRNRQAGLADPSPDPGPVRQNEQESKDSAWIPTLTPEGQVRALPLLMPR